MEDINPITLDAAIFLAQSYDIMQLDCNQEHLDEETMVEEVASLQEGEVAGTLVIIMDTQDEAHITKTI